MRKRILSFVWILIALLFGVVNLAWAATPSAESLQNPFILPRQNSLRYTNEATVRARVSNPKDFPATPPGLLRLRERIATQESQAALLKRHVFFGTVSGILPANKAFTLSTKDGPKTIQTNEETKFLTGKYKGGARATFESLKVGDRVVAVGRVDGEGLATAKIVIIIPANAPQIKRRAAYGVVEQKVASDSATLLKLRHPQNKKIFQVVVTPETRITGKGLSNPTANDIQIGSRVVAVGTVDEEGKITAKRLHIIPGLARGLFGTQPSTPSNKPATPPGLLKKPTATPTVVPPTPTAAPTP